jgi:mannose-6-phosphate isomerase-like protein (cupin superfamily)
MNRRYELLHFDQVPSLDCPCGTTRRAFVNDAEQVGSLHVVATDGTAQTHYHKRTTEIYYFLEGEGQLELDGETFDVRPGSSVLIKPECRHRAIGTLRFINVSIPAFDPADEWFDS